MDDLELIKKRIEESIDAKKEFLREAENISKASDAIVQSLKNGGKILVFGNGGSAADSQHIAGELVGRYKEERRALPAVALTTDTSIITSLGNDYGFEDIFSRQVEALGKKGDVLMVLTTSDYNEEDRHSINLKNVLEKARDIGMTTVGLYSLKSDRIADLTDIVVRATSRDTPRIQECHQLAYHAICEIVEREMKDFYGGKK